MRNRVGAWIFLVFAVGPVAAEQASHPFAIDQANDAILRTYGFVIPGYGAVGQSFIPTFSSLNVVELQLNSQSYFGGSAMVQIRSGGIAGPILGASQSATVPPYSTPPSIALAHFDFLVPVALTPGDTYVIEVIAVSGIMGVFTSGENTNTYPLGTAFFGGAPRPGDDLWFREGESAVLPVSEVTWGRVKAVYR